MRQMRTLRQGQEPSQCSTGWTTHAVDDSQREKIRAHHEAVNEGRRGGGFPRHWRCACRPA
eukprot:10786585-Heterocapsa_arctica.AAC.1